VKALPTDRAAVGATAHTPARVRHAAPRSDFADRDAMLDALARHGFDRLAGDFAPGAIETADTDAATTFLRGKRPSA
jgi:hypothetical protein